MSDKNKIFNPFYEPSVSDIHVAEWETVQIIHRSPEWFLDKTAELENTTTNFMQNIHDETISKKYAKDMLKGDKFPPPIIVNIMYSDRVDGIHRAYAAKNARYKRNTYYTNYRFNYRKRNRMVRRYLGYMEYLNLKKL